ncbi:MAG: HAD family phosphatase [Clostridia bacterium]|nr:HAD family phosphatase [Clostridia bacterium]
MQKLDNVKVIFIDIDGTLTNRKKEVTTYTSEIIKKVVEKGIKVIICSGRGNQYVEDKSRIANASSHIISSNGAQIYNYYTKEILYKSVINKEVLKEAIEFINKKQGGYILNCTNIRYSNKNLNRKMNKNDKVINSIDEVEDEVYQLVMEASSYNQMSEMIEYVKNNEYLQILNCSHSYLKGKKDESHYYIDVNNTGVSKGNAIKKYLELFNIKKEDSVCFGDHINDVSMFEVCGIKVAMGNANDDLKEQADYVTLTNEEDGVAKFLEMHVL